MVGSSTSDGENGGGTIWSFDVCVPTQQVEIDIKPGSDSNSVNLNSNGRIAVAILSTDEFDATQVDASTVVFAGALAVRSGLEDVDN